MHKSQHSVLKKLHPKPIHLYTVTVIITQRYAQHMCMSYSSPSPEGNSVQLWSRSLRGHEAGDAELQTLVLWLVK